MRRSRVMTAATLRLTQLLREATTWAMNAYLPGMICEKFHAARIVAFSTGNVYAMTPVDRGGVPEDAPIELRVAYLVAKGHGTSQTETYEAGSCH